MRSLLISLCLAGSVAHAVPAQFTQQGRLLDADGLPVEGDVSITFRVIIAATDGEGLWEETQTISLTNGFYGAVLGRGGQ